jgi:elongation factor Ts
MEALKDVRSRSGAPIVECKKALKAVADAGGGASGTDVVALALDWLREHGAAKAASKLRDREATEGLVCVAISPDGKRGSLVQVSSETDFAGRSDRFLDLATTVADAALKQKLCRNGPVPLEGLLELPDGATGKTIRDLLDEAVVAIRENLGVSHAAAISCNEDGGDDDSIVVGYVHNRVGSSSAGTAAAIVELGSADPAKRPVGSEVLQAVGKKLAMHVVAAKPQHLRLQDVPGEAVDRELEILRKQQEGSGKPPEIVEKVVQGRLRKFYESVCLLDQPHFIEDKNPKVGSYLSEQGIVVKRFEARSIAS